MEQLVDFAVGFCALALAARPVALAALSSPPRRWVGLVQLGVIGCLWCFGSFTAALLVAAVFSYGARVFVALVTFVTVVFELVHR